MSGQRFLTSTIAAAALAAGAVLSGCGAAQTVKQVVDPVAQAAVVTAQVPGYRIAGTMTIGVGTSAEGHATIAGVLDRSPEAGALTVHESIAGHSVTANERFAGTTVYMNAAQLSNGSSQVPGGKPWIKYDMSRAMGSLGLGGLSPTGSDPSQFLGDPRAAGGKATRVGTQAIRGVATTHYHAVVSLDRYPRLVAPAQRAAAARGVSVLESALGTHSMPMDVWIDSHKLVRRMSFAFAECVQNQHLNLEHDAGPVYHIGRSWLDPPGRRHRPTTSPRRSPSCSRTPSSAAPAPPSGPQQRS